MTTADNKNCRQSNFFLSAVRRIFLSFESGDGGGCRCRKVTRWESGQHEHGTPGYGYDKACDFVSAEFRTQECPESG